MSDDLMVREDSQTQTISEETRPAPVFSPPVDIYETEQELVLVADVPGLAKESLEIRLDKDVLTLEGAMDDSFGPGETELLREYRTGRYLRRFTLGEAIDRQGIRAKLKNGELKLVLPKAKEAKPRRIEVTAS